MAIEVYVDGAARGNPGPAGIGIVIKDGSRVLGEIGAYIGKTTNNIAEYLALIRGLEEVLVRGFRSASFFSDSELLVKQLNGEYKVKHENLVPLHYHILTLIDRMKDFSIKHVTRDKNAHADKMANEGIDLHDQTAPLFSPKACQRQAGGSAYGGKTI
ncbi:MAG: ribonuclease HI family protein [bacterium]